MPAVYRTGRNRSSPHETNTAVRSYDKAMIKRFLNVSPVAHHGLRRMIVALVGLASLTATAAPPPSPPRVVSVAPDERPLPMPVTVAELSVSIRRFEQAFKPAALEAARIEAMNRAFDGAAAHFFAGRYRNAVAELDEMTAELSGRADDTAYRALLSLGMECEPAHAIIGETEMVMIRLASLYPAPEAMRGQSVRVRLGLVDWAGERTVWIDEIELQATESGVIEWRGQFDVSTFKGARFATLMLFAATEDDTTLFPGSFTIGPRSFAAEREALEASLESVGDELAGARSLARSRCTMLVDRAVKTDLTRWIVDRAAVAQALRGEVSALMRGENPYRERRGNLWAALPLGRTELPCRIYVPSAIMHGEPLPVVVALHGAGGNEHMFFEAYDAGRIVELAEEHGFIAVAPLTYPMLADASLFPALIDFIDKTIAPIDRERIGLMGHSLGAMTTMSIASAHGELLAGIVPIAGNGRMAFDAAALPCRAYAAEYDFLLQASAVRAGVERLQNAQPDAQIEFKLVEGAGHVLIVNQILDEAVAWLLEQRR